MFRFSEQLLPIVFLIPLWGIVIGAVANYHSMLNKTGSKIISLESLRLADDDIRMFRINEEETENVLVPLEEAMSINDSDTRRELMMDILHKNPNEYISLLQQARLDSDIEVIHYASTAMMEIQRDYELAVQKAERNYEEHPEVEQNLINYANSIKRYIESGMIEENILFIHRKRYADLLEVQMGKYPDNIDGFLEAANNYMEIGNYTSANVVIATLISKWPADEKAWFAKIKLCQQLNDGEGLKKSIEELKRRRVYLTPEGKTILRYWDNTIDYD